jgi:hypothetical protein
LRGENEEGHGEIVARKRHVARFASVTAKITALLIMNQCFDFESQGEGGRMTLQTSADIAQILGTLIALIQLAIILRKK